MIIWKPLRQCARCKFFSASEILKGAENPDFAPCFSMFVRAWVFPLSWFHQNFFFKHVVFCVDKKWKVFFAPNFLGASFQNFSFGTQVIWVFAQLFHMWQKLRKRRKSMRLEAQRKLASDAKSQMAFKTSNELPNANLSSSWCCQHFVLEVEMLLSSALL